MLIVLLHLPRSAVAAAVAGHQAVAAQDQDQVSPPAVAANQEVPNPEEVPKEVPTRVARARVHVVHLDAAKLDDTPSPLNPDST